MHGASEQPAPPGASVGATSSWRSLAHFAVELTTTTTLEDLQIGLTRRAAEVFDAAGCTVVVGADDGGWELLLPATTAVSPAGRRFEREPFDSPLPACRAAREGVLFLLPDRTAAVEVHPRMAEVVDVTGRPRWALVPLWAAGELIGSLAVSWSTPAAFDESTRTLLETFAAHSAPTLARLLASTRRDVASAGAVRLSSRLQRRSLGTLPERDGVALAVGYRPAQSSVDIGGDWYDAFENRAGDLVLVLGDVSGHDDRAAAAMSQVRALLRGVVWNSLDSPAHLLQRLDEVMTALEPGVLASAVLAVLHDDGAAGASIDWASAGHPSPLVRRPDHAVDLLRDGSEGGVTPADPRTRRRFRAGDEGFADDRDPILGVDPAVARHDHHARLAVGSALLLYSDGMVEARGEEFSAGLERLARRFASVQLDDPAAGAERLMTTGAPRPDEGRSADLDDRTVLVAVVRDESATAAPDLAAAPGPLESSDAGSDTSSDTGTDGGSDGDWGGEGDTTPPAPVTSRALQLAAEPRAAGRARRVVERACADVGWAEDPTATVVLLTSELVTNALVHGRSEATLTVRATPTTVRVQVWDDNHRAPEVLADDDLALSGRGLHLVAACAQEWGVDWPTEAHTPGKGVWFTVAAG